VLAVSAAPQSISAGLDGSAPRFFCHPKTRVGASGNGLGERTVWKLVNFFS